MKAYRGRGVKLHSILASALDGTEWSTSRPHRFSVPAEPRYVLNTKLGGPQNRFRSSGEEKTPFASTGIRTPDRTAYSMRNVTVLYVCW
jgi:hypothetical protein